MGATTFQHRASGKTAEQALTSARAEAKYDHGHSGYTGTIAEKTSLVMIKEFAAVAGEDFADRCKRASDLAGKLIEADDARIHDKWGPAGCIDLGVKPGKRSEHEYLFFGWASC